MRGKGCESQAAHSSSTNFPHLHPISFKNSNSKSIPANPNPNHAYLQQLPDYRFHWDIVSTTVYSLNSDVTSDIPRLCAAVCTYGPYVNREPELLHPLTLKPYPYNRPINFKLLKNQTTSLVSFTHTSNFPFDKFVITLPRAAAVNGDVMVVLYGGGKLLGRLPLVKGQNTVKWVVLSEDKFDDIVAFIGCTYVVDRLGKLYMIDSGTHSGRLSLGRAVITEPIPRGSVRVGWRKRFMVDGGDLRMVVREEEKVFRVYMLTRDTPDLWDEIVSFGGVLIVFKDCCFSMDCFGGEEYKNCILFSESGFPKYGDDGGWEYNDEDGIGVYRMSDGLFGRVGDSVDFPNIDWSLPSWIFDVRVPDEDVGGVQSKAANVEGDTSLQKDVHASVFASVSAVEEEVTRTLVRMNGGNVATEKEFSRKNTTVSAPTACTSSSTAKGINSDSAATAKFEGFDVRSDLVPILQKIWRNHGNIIQNSTMRNSDIIARALESLATMVDILENNPIQSLSDFQAGYLSSALSDLKNMGFKMHWLVLFVEKAVKLHKSKALVDSLNKLRELSSQVKEHRDILVDDVAKLNEEENKLEKEMAKVSNLIPFSRQVKFDKPLGSGLT